MFLCILLLFVALILVVTALLITNLQRRLPVTDGTRCLLLIAHPDDECSKDEHFIIQQHTLQQSLTHTLVLFKNNCTDDNSFFRSILLRISWNKSRVRFLFTSLVSGCRSLPVIGALILAKLSAFITIEFEIWVNNYFITKN